MKIRCVVKCGKWRTRGRVILDPSTETASVYRDDGQQQVLTSADELTIPDVLPGFAVPVASLFA